MECGGFYGGSAGTAVAAAAASISFPQALLELSSVYDSGYSRGASPYSRRHCHLDDVHIKTFTHRSRLRTIHASRSLAVA